MNKFLKNKHVNKFLYGQQFKQDATLDIKHENKWQGIFEESSLNWKHIYLAPIKSTIDTILREFQYKFLTRIIPTNSFLYKCKISNTTLCDFCCRDIETFKHLFWECHYSQHFWSQLKSFLSESNIEIVMNYELICFGKINNEQKDNLINFIIFSAKYFIFKNKYLKTVPNVAGYKIFLQKRIEIEKFIALEKDKLHQHISKWSSFII